MVNKLLKKLIIIRIYDAIIKMIMYASIKFPNRIPISFREVLPSKLFLGVLNIYIIPNGKNSIGMKTIYLVIMKETIAITNDIKQATQITN